MIKKEDFFLFGKVIKTLGFNGEILVSSDHKPAGKMKKGEPVFLDLEGNLVPFFIEEIRPATKQSFSIKLSDILSNTSALRLIDANVYLPGPMKSRPVFKDFSTSDLIGFQVIDREKGIIGTVDQVLDHTSQLLLLVVDDRHEILIPMVDEIILRIDPDKKTIEIQAPEGLLELNQ